MRACLSYLSISSILLHIQLSESSNIVHETNYFIRTIRNEHFWRKEIGESNIVLFSEPWISTTPRYLCVDPENFDPNIMKNLEMLAHKICVANDYPTFDWIGLKNISSNFRLPEISHIHCFQRDDLSIDCIRSRLMDEVNRSCHFLSLKCGSCQRKYSTEILLCDSRS